MNPLSTETETIAADLLPYQSQSLDVGGYRMRYLDEGEGERVLLCSHGNPTWSFYFRRIIDRFASSYRVIAVDHIGCGRSDKPSRQAYPYTLKQHGDDLVQLIEELDLRKITLIAHDWGGPIGLSALNRCRDRFNSIVLLNTGAFPPPYVPWRIRACRFPILGTLAVRGLNAFARAAVTMAMNRRPMDRDTAMGLLAPYDNWDHRVAIDAFVRDIPMSKNHPTLIELQRLEQSLADFSGLEALLVWGMKDWCFRPDCLRRFQAAWPQATAVEIDDAGHYVLEDAPEETLDAIESFLGRIDGREGIEGREASDGARADRLTEAERQAGGAR